MSYSLMRPKTLDKEGDIFATKPYSAVARGNEESPPPLADIFLLCSISEGTTKQDIVDNEADIKRTVGDIVQIPKPNETSHVVSLKISVQLRIFRKPWIPLYGPCEFVFVNLSII